MTEVRKEDSSLSPLLPLHRSRHQQRTDSAGHGSPGVGAQGGSQKVQAAWEPRKDLPGSAGLRLGATEYTSGLQNGTVHIPVTQVPLYTGLPKEHLT